MRTNLRKTLILGIVGCGIALVPVVVLGVSDPNVEAQEAGLALCQAALDADVERVRELLAPPDGPVEAAGEDSPAVDVDAPGLHGRTPLHCAVIGGSVPIVAELLAAGADPRAVDDSGNTPLFFPPPEDEPAIARLLIEKGARVDVRNRAGVTPLWGVAVVGHHRLANLYLENGLDVVGSGKATKVGLDALSVAVERGHYDVAKLLVEAGVGVDDPVTGALGGQGATLLYSMAELGQADAVDFLVEHGAKVDLAPPCCDGAVPLLAAARQGHTDALKLLLAAGADIETLDTSGWTPLLEAARLGHAEAVQVLINAGADVDGRGLEKTENTPLLWAVMQGHADVARALVEAGAGLDEANRSGVVPLMHAAFRGDVDLATLLLDRGAAPETENQAGRTPLLFAVFRKHLDVTRLLLERGARLDVKSRIDGFGLVDPLMLAAGRGLVELTQLLLDHGADPMAKSTVVQIGRATPLLVAARRGHVEAVRLLLDRMPADGSGDRSGDVLGEIANALDQAEEMGHADVVDLLRARSRRAEAS